VAFVSFSRLGSIGHTINSLPCNVGQRNWKHATCFRLTKIAVKALIPWYRVDFGLRTRLQQNCGRVLSRPQSRRSRHIGPRG
jgi:hypothetical protein